MNIYFDNAATTMVCVEAADVVVRVMRENYGNPSSGHLMGRVAMSELTDARVNIAKALGADASEIYFTSGGTESVNWAILGSVPVNIRNGGHIITSASEHSAVLESLKLREQTGWDVTYLKPGSHGRITIDDFKAALRDDTVFASIMLVNNETGTVNPISEFTKEIKRRGLKTVFFTDAVQAFCKIPFTVKSLGIDLLSVSAHKLHGPKGVGALYIKNGITLNSIHHGGVQEEKKRPGTEALPAIAGFSAAVKSSFDNLDSNFSQVKKLREYMIDKLKHQLPELVVIGDGDSPYILSISLPGHKSEVLMSFLDNEGIRVTKGSACRKGKRSRVLESMNLKNEVIDGAIRVSFSRYNTYEEVDYFTCKFKEASEKLLK